MSDFFGSGKGRPTNTDESADMIAKSLNWMYPRVTDQILSQYPKYATAEYDIAKQYTPQVAQLQLDTMKDQGAGMAELGRELSRQEQLGAAQTEADILKGPGADAARQQLALQKEADPEYFKNITALADRLNKAFDALGTNPGEANPDEIEQTSRALGRNNWAAGSAQQDLASAASFGDAAAKRRAEWTGLLNTSAAIQPQLKSGVDMGAAARTRTVLPNWGTQQYTGIQTPGMNAANAFGQTALQGLFNTEQTSKNKAESTADAQLKYTQSLSNIASAAGSFAGMCWVARAAFGEDSSEWVTFRNWLCTKAPVGVWYAYLKYGPTLAEVVKSSPLIQCMTRFVMRRVIKSN